MIRLNKAYILPLIITMFILDTHFTHAQGRKHYKSDNSYSRYDSKDSSERKDFDKNFNRYQHLSPQQKQEKLDKWREFKSNTTPEERDFIMKKMRRDRRRGR
ncbi:MAG: hypothetical protein M9899_08980 [Bdellovibrionaceae bacterium]|nr:hypothetical protein [Pseudobdellovibrionaceae bacterium]